MLLMKNVEGPIAFGVEHLKRLAEVLDENLLKAEKAFAPKGDNLEGKK
jgi:hypothetical protein